MDIEMYNRKQNEKEIDFDYNKSLENTMDGFEDIKGVKSLVTEEGLRDWLMQSINRKFDKMPEQRPFMMRENVYKMLKETDHLVNTMPVGNKRRPKTAVRKKSGDQLKTNMTKDQVDEILAIKTPNHRSLEPRTVEGGVPFTSPRAKSLQKRVYINKPVKMQSFLNSPASVSR